MPETHWHVRSAITGARVIIDVTEEQATGECERLNREAETGERAAYGEGAHHVPAQRLVPENSGQSLTQRITVPENDAYFVDDAGNVVKVPMSVSDALEQITGYTRLPAIPVEISDADLLDPSLVGRVLHAGQAMVYEVEREDRPTEAELEEFAREAGPR